MPNLTDVASIVSHLRPGESTFASPPTAEITDGRMAIPGRGIYKAWAPLSLVDSEHPTSVTFHLEVQYKQALGGSLVAADGGRVDELQKETTVASYTHKSTGSGELSEAKRDMFMLGSSHLNTWTLHVDHSEKVSFVVGPSSFFRADVGDVILLKFQGANITLWTRDKACTIQLMQVA